MNQFLQIRRGLWQVTRLILLLLVGLTANLPRATFAHDLFTAYVQHSVQLSVNASHIDLTLDLTFFEEWSAKERLAMDTDSDGRISRREMDVYVKKLAPQIVKQVKVRVAGRELSLAPLYEPEIDLLGNDQAGPAHHRLRIFFFAMTPVELRAGDKIVIEDSLWPKAQTLGMLRTEGDDGAALASEKDGDLFSTTSQTGEARRFTAHCLKPPSAKTNVMSQRQTEPVQ